MIQTIPDDITTSEARDLMLALPDYPPWWYLAHPNIVPKMVHPLSKHWQQPSVDAIQITDTYAKMTRATFDLLADYSASQPTGCYPGKMWKAHYRADGWWLKWFGYSEKGDDWCTTYGRMIEIMPVLSYGP